MAKIEDLDPLEVWGDLLPQKVKVPPKQFKLKVGDEPTIITEYGIIPPKWRDRPPPKKLSAIEQLEVARLARQQDEERRAEASAQMRALWKESERLLRDAEIERRAKMPPPAEPCKNIFDAIDKWKDTGDYVILNKVPLTGTCLVDMYNRTIRSTQRGECEVGFSNTSIAFKQGTGEVESADIVFPACFNGDSPRVRFYAESGHNLPKECHVTGVHLHAGNRCPAVHVHMKCDFFIEKDAVKGMTTILEGVNNFTDLSCKAENRMQ